MKLDPRNIAHDDFCPCGSGKRYADCCMGENRSYAVIECGERNISFDVADLETQVATLIAYLVENVVRPYNEGVAIDPSMALKKLQKIYGMFEKCVQPFAQSSSCGKGCSFCCQHLLETSAIEVELVRGFVEKHFDAEKKRSVISKIKKNLKHYPGPVDTAEEFTDEMQEQHFEHHIPCAFLSQQHACLIYDVRPLVCRTYMVFSNPSQCELGEGLAIYDADYISDVHTAVQCLALHVYRDLTYRKHFPRWFMEEFSF